jgi:DNA-binding XRE family transcriptional regulator
MRDKSHKRKCGEKLKTHRIRACLTEEEAAKALGISRNTLIRYEKEETYPPLDVFIEMLKLYDFDGIDILNAKEPAYPKTAWYAILCAHVRYEVRRECEMQARFGRVLDDESMNISYRNKLETYLSIPPYSLISEITEQASLDTERKY